MGQGIERLGKISGRESAQLYFVAGHLGFQGRKAHQPEGQCRTRNPAGVSRLGGCTGMWEGHLRGLCGGLWLAGGKVRNHGVHGAIHTLRFGLTALLDSDFVLSSSSKLGYLHGGPLLLEFADS